MVLANEKNEVWIAMELLDGNLDEFLRNEKYEIPFETHIKILIDAAKGMEHVAKKGFVHRDIACRNIMISVGGREGKYYLSIWVETPSWTTYGCNNFHDREQIYLQKITIRTIYAYNDDNKSILSPL